MNNLSFPASQSKGFISGLTHVATSWFPSSDELHLPTRALHPIHYPAHDEYWILQGSKSLLHDSSLPDLKVKTYILAYT